MIPKIYIIESSDQQGLIKIGHTGIRTEDDNVYARIGDYKEALSDNSVVHETYGAKIFESYFHEFVRDHNKEIEISFIKNIQTYSPKEWFYLAQNDCEALTKAFSNAPPMRIHEVQKEYLPTFLSGVLSAIHWHATKTSLVVQEAEQANIELSKVIQQYYLSRQEVDSTSSHQFVEDANREINLSENLSDYANKSLQIAKSLEEKNVKLQELEQLETSRSIIAIVAAALVFFLLWSAPTQSSWLAIISLILLIIWPLLQPKLAIWLYEFKHRASKAREKISEIDQQNDN